MSNIPVWGEALGAAGVAAIGWAGKILVDHRKTSGTIATSQAQEIWDASKEVRDNLVEDLLRVRAELDRTLERLRLANQETEAALLHVRELEELVYKLRRQIERTGAESEDIHRTWLKGQQPDE